MAQWQLGRVDEARATLARLRAAMKDEDNAKEADFVALAREAEEPMGRRPTSPSMADRAAEPLLWAP